MTINTKKNKIFAISDIHGHYDELMALYKKLPINPKRDTLIIMGDHIDRGPDSRKVVEQLIKWKKKYPHWQFLYGNHEDLMLDSLVYGGRIYDSFYLWYRQGGKETTYSYMPEGLSLLEQALVRPENIIPEEHLLFLASLPRYYETDDYIFVHGGVKPGKSVEDTDPQDLIWIRDEFIDSDYDWGKKIIFGHTAVPVKLGEDIVDFLPIVKENKIGIDTAVCSPSGNGKLSALELPIEKFYFQKIISN